MDQLIAAYRLDEAEHYCNCFASLDDSYRVPLYRGIIARHRGERENAFTIWSQMEAAYPEEWCVWHIVGDYLARSGLYNEAMAHYRKAMDVQKESILVDPLQSMAQLCEIRWDINGAIAARQEEANLLEKHWNISGEGLDCMLRDIQRLEKKLVK